MKTCTILVAVAALFFGGALASAQSSGGGLCADPPAFCQRFMKPVCLGSLGAGSEAAGAGANCAAQLDAYRTCVAAAAETCTTSANTQDTAKPGGVYTIASISAKLLRKPSISSSVKNVGIASRGAVARLLENGPNGQFVRIEILAAGPSLPLRAARGWTPADAIRPAPESLAPTPLKPGQRAWVDAYTIPLIPKPEAEGTVLSAKGWVKRGSEVEVIERFLDPTDGPFIRFKLLKAADGSKPLAEEAWTPEANLTAQKSD